MPINNKMVLERSRLYKSTSRLHVRSHVQIHVRGVPFNIDRELLAAKSAKISAILRGNSQEDLSYFFRDLPADPATFELVARFCHGYEVNITTENVVPVSCLAYYLEMTEKHSPDNLLNRALHFFEQRILPSWNETVKALRASDCSDCIFQQTVDLGFADACLESIISKALIDPRLLGEPIKNPTYDAEEDDDIDDDGDNYRPNARKRLFDFDWKSEDLTNLSLRIFKPIICEMVLRQVPSEFVAASLCQYAKKWAFSCTTEKRNQTMLIYKKNSPREVIEAVESLLPHERGLLPCTLLFEMLHFAILLEANSECRYGFESRIGKQLEKATVKDLLIPSQGYAKEEQYDIECVKRIVKHFYSNYTSSGISGLIKVAELIEGFLAEIASDIDLKPDTFTLVAEMSAAASSETNRSSDGIYRAIDLYLDKHRYLTESEREDVCSILDCQKMSSEACEHAAKNKLFPLRVVVQVLFVSQLQLRGTIMKEVQGTENRMTKVENQEEEEAITGCGEEEARTEMEKMGSKVLELKRECHMMRREIQNGYSHRVKKDKVSMWTEMKRKFGCLSSMHDCNCQDKKKKKKVHPR